MSDVLADVPWTAIRSRFARFRSRFFTRPRPTGRYFRVSGRPEPALGRLCYAPNWETSYAYRGEELNLARVFYSEILRPESGVVWWQYHVRGWRNGGYWELRAHLEPEPTEHPDEHLAGVGFDVDAGMLELRWAIGRSALVFEEEFSYED